MSTRTWTAAGIVERPDGQVLTDDVRHAQVPFAEGTDKREAVHRLKVKLEEEHGIEMRDGQAISERAIEEPGTTHFQTVYRIQGWSSTGRTHLGWAYPESMSDPGAAMSTGTEPTQWALERWTEHRQGIGERGTTLVHRSTQVCRVVVGIIEQPDGRILAEQRRENAKWCHPGGKARCGETMENALARELAEELGIAVHEPRHLIQVVREDEIVHRDVKLVIDAYRVRRWDGEARGCEGQVIEWMHPHEMDARAHLDAVKPINVMLRQARAGRNEETSRVAEALGVALVALRDLDLGYPARELADGLHEAVQVGLEHGVDKRDIDCDLLTRDSGEGERSQ